MPLSVRRLLEWEAPEINWILDHNLIVPGGKIVAYGAKESFKSMLFGVNLAFCIATGNRWLGEFETRKSSVLVVQTEVPLFALQNRVQSYVKGHNGIMPDNLWYETTELKVNRPGGHDYNVLKGWIEKYQPNVLILDPLYELLYGDLNSNVDLRNLLHLINRVSRETEDTIGEKLATVVIHHESKKTFDYLGREIERGTDSAYGGAPLLWWCDTAFGLDRNQDERSKVTLSFDKLRLYFHGDIPDKKLNYYPGTIDFLPEREELQGGLV